MAVLYGIYVEDEKSEGTKYSALLSRKGALKVDSVLAPVPMDVKSIVDKKPDIILVDYVLTQKQTEGAMASYKGGTLATAIRERYPNCPIILVTRMILLKKYKGAPRQLGPVDLQFFKDQIRNNPDRCINEIIALAKGYKKLRESSPLTWSRILDLMGATPRESETLREVKPAGFDLGAGGRRARWSVPEVAVWIMDSIFQYPGILYDDLHAATSLGMSVESLAQKEVMSALSPALYKGVLCHLSRQWWRDRLTAEGYRIIKKAGLQPPLSQSFVPAVRSILKVDAHPSKCIYSEKSFADTVCYVLQAPTLRENSLAYFPDTRPKVMDEARVSYEAFKSPEFHEEFLNAEGKGIFREIIGGSTRKHR